MPINFVAGPETLVNTWVSSEQTDPSVAALVGGGYVVTWRSLAQDGSGQGIYMQRFDSSGAALGIEMQVNSTTASDQTGPSVAALSGGGYVVTWASTDQDGDGSGVYMQRYDSAGVALGVETLVNSTTVGFQLETAVTALSGGGYVVTWSSTDQDGSGSGVYMQRFNSSGTALGGELRVNSHVAGDQRLSAVAALSGGGYVVTWMSGGQDGDSVGVYMQRYDALGAALGSETLVNSTVADYQGFQAVAALTGGGFVVTWISDGQDGDSFGIYMQRYDAAGMPQGGETRVNTTTAGAQLQPAVSPLTDGGYVVTWTSDGLDGSGGGIYMQRYNASGVAQGSETLVNTVTASEQDTSAVTVLPNGSFIVTWQSYGQDSVSGYGIYSKLYTAVDSVITVATTTDFTGQTLTDKDGITFTGAATATFTADQFGPGLIASTAAVTGNANANAIVINQTAAGTFTAAGLTFSNWTAGTDTLSINGSAGADSITGSGQRDSIAGGLDNDTLVGLAGNDTLNGGDGADSMLGGADDDTYVVDNALDVVTELANEGTDTVQTALATYALTSANVENLTGTSATAQSLTGNTLNNVITGGVSNDALDGGDGNDTLIGGTGFDSMTGGAGDDSYYLNGADTIVEAANGGIDTIYTAALPGIGSTNPVSSAWFNLGNYNNVENVTGIAATGQWLAGNALSNVVTGGIGGDYLFGGTGGIDTLVGGLGDDWYYLNAANTDVIIENANGGTDTVYLEAADVRTYTLVANVEWLWVNQASLQTVGDGTYYGNELNNRFVMSSQGSDTLYGLGGDDDIDGGIGNDQISGGQGVDDLKGGSGNDTLDGGTENDQLGGGTGNDVFIAVESGDLVYEFAGEGTDRIETAVASYTLSDNVTIGHVENLTGTATTAQTLTGNRLNNVISGGIGNDTLVGLDGNDTLNGGAGDDSMSGGSGDDIYFVESVNDVVVEIANEGTDTIRTTLASQSLAGTELENLVGLSATAQALTGNAYNNAITGGDADDTLTGGDGDDTLNGGVGNDSMIGGAGNDVYFVDSAADTVVEIANEGTDTVNTALATYSLQLTQIENLTGTSATGQALTGNSFANVITGGVGNDTLDGRTGNDTLAGGAGDDTYLNVDAGDTITEGAGAGTDTIITSIANYTLAANFENLTGTFLTGQTLTGNSVGNAITGSIGNDTLDGSGGNDTLSGGLGNDTYIVDATGDVVIEQLGEGTLDTITTSLASYTLTAANVEFLTGTAATGQTLTGLAAARTVITGGSGNDTLIGGSQADTLIGGAGTNSLTGGLGDDIYLVESATDVIVEAANGGIADRVQTSLAAFTLADNVENLTGTGQNQTLTGNGLDNFIVGNAAAGSTGVYQGLAGNDGLYGSLGNETLDGGTGDDTMQGGAGDDTYVVDSALDVIVENANEGSDTIQTSSASYTLNTANIENLTGISATAQTLTGNSGDNVITGGVANDTLNGDAGNDTLDGGAGADSLLGGAGDDTYLNFNFGVDSVNELDGEGNDTIITDAASVFLFGFGGFIENVTFTGAANHSIIGNVLNNVFTGNIGNDSLFGSDGNDTLIGLDGNDTLNGGLGTDSLVGGIGNDTYLVDTALDVVVELAGEGTDTVQTTLATYTLGDNVERLEGVGLVTDVSRTYTGNDLNNVISGAPLNDLLSGGSGDDLLSGLQGNDTLDGGSGDDTMFGLTGDDTYIVDSLLDQVFEQANEGTDTIQTALAVFTLTAGFAHTENLTGTATTGQTLTGNGDNNVITGGIGKDTLNGGNGNDTLVGGAGNDSLLGGGGDDVYEVTEVGDVVVELANEGTDRVTTALATYTIGDNIEELVAVGNNANRTFAGGGTADRITGAGGNDSLSGAAGADTLTGESGNDTLDGGAGNDSMVGGAGDDTYIVDSASDALVELAAQGTDTVRTALATYTLTAAHIENLVGTATTGQALTGNADVNTIIGGIGDDTLDGRAGADRLDGGAGNDTYIIDDVGDTIADVSGTDGVQTTLAAYTLNAGIEFLVGTSTLAQTLTGNDGNNSISGSMGDDTINGGLGADSLDGGTGNDTYIIDNAGDTITDVSGTDTARTALLAYTLAANVEHLVGTAAVAQVLTGNSGNNSISGSTGNDTLDGGTAGDDTLDGGIGNDFMSGGAGNDTYIVDALGDVVSEAAGMGTADEVRTSLNYYVLTTNVENVALTGPGYSQAFGTAAANLMVGSESDNNIFGYDGNDTIEGNGGDDYLYGGSGTNILRGGAGLDRIFGDDMTASLDYVQGGDDQDIITTYGGNDTLYGDGGDDWLVAGDGNDGLFGGAGYDNLDGGAGNDTLNGGADQDILRGGADNDVMTDTAGNNWFFGDAGADSMTGGAGYENFDGGDGSDTMAGGGELDIYRGGLGGDLFRINAATDKGFVDWILDFGIGGFGDTIQLDVADTGAPQTTVAVYGATDVIITYRVGAGGPGNVGWIVVTDTTVAAVNANLVFV